LQTGMLISGDSYSTVYMDIYLVNQTRI